MKSLNNNNNKFNNKLLNKEYFSSLNKNIIFSVYMIIKYEFKKKLGRKCKVSLLEQIMITLFKLRYNLPDRILEDLFQIDHVTISRIIIRISLYLSKLKVNINNIEEEIYYCVDSTILRIGRGKSKDTYSGYKHHHGVKFQVTINNENIIKHLSKSYRIMQRLNYYSKNKIEIIFNSIANIYNLQQLFNNLSFIRKFYSIFYFNHNKTCFIYS